MIKKFTLFATAIVATMISAAAPTRTGIAMSAQSKVFQSSKQMIIQYATALLEDLHFDDITIPVINWRIHDMKFSAVKLNVEDFDIYINGDQVNVRIRDAGGSF